MNISLTGMPASGKTTVAKALQELLPGYKLIDTDEKIIQNENSTINEIFKNKGEKYFRRLETDILKTVLQADNQIISTGGGIITSDENIELLKKYSTIIYLKAKLETLLERAKKSSDRPLLNDCSIKEKLEKLLREREEMYKKAHITIEIEEKTPEQTAKEIMETIYENNRCKNKTC